VSTVQWRCGVKPESIQTMRSHALRGIRVSVAAALPLAFGACTWFTDFKDQPRIEPWEPMSQNPNDTTTPPRGNPQFSVPIQGSYSPAIAVSYLATPATIDSMSGIANPLGADARSLDNGRKLYQINCAVCHGPAGNANGTMKRVNPAYQWSPSLLTAQARAHSDGYLYGIIRNGRGAMPSYNRIEEQERWDVVNYVRTLQAGTADTSAAGYPGQNGAAVPGPSLTAPTRPSAYARFTQQPTPGSPGVNSATFQSKNEGEGVKALHGAPHAEKGAAGETTRAGSPPNSKERP
jgi:mono/diheme cytochrome c family protein